MTSPRKQAFRTRRAAAIGLLVAIPLLPLSACGQGEDEADVGTEEQVDETGGQEGGEDDGGGY